MLKITINHHAYLVPAHPQEATLEFFERVHKKLGSDLEERELFTLIIGCPLSDIEATTEADYYQLSAKLYGLIKWLPQWMRDCDKAEPIRYRVGVAPVGFLNKYVYRHKTEKVYDMPKNWLLHSWGATALLDGWLKEPERPTLVSDVISLYLAPSVFGYHFTEEDREALRQDILQRPALEVIGFFKFALKKRTTFSGLWEILAGRLRRWVRTLNPSKG